MRVKWLHLSDIHFNYKNYESHSLREDFLNRIQSLDQSEPFTHLFITGDILYRNLQADDDTIEFVKKLISIMRLSRESVFIIPGNHDHDRTVTQEVLARLFDGVKKKERDTKIDNLNTTDITVLLESQTNYNDACSKIFDEKEYSWNKPHFITIQDGISIINMNTSWLDSDSSSRADYLRIGSRLLQLELSNEEAQLGQSLNIAIGHHTLEDMLPQERNRVLDQFKRHNIGLYFCGHHHKPKIKYYDGYDVLEFVAPGGYNDEYSNGGYIWGIIDTDNDFYKAEVYGWYDNKWCIESKLDGTDEYGFYYFHTEKFDHNSNIVAIDCKTMNGHIPRRELERSIGDKRFDVHIYNGPVGNVNGYTLESIQDLARNIHELIEKNEIVHLYPLAPIPMLIALGFEIQSDTNITVHQFDRDTKSWVLSGEDWGAKLETSVIERNNNKVIAVSISTSYQIEKAQIEAAMGNVAYDYLEIKTDKITPGYPLFSNDVDSIAKNIILILNEKVNKYEEIHLFAAIPAGMAVELGRGMLKTVYNNIYTYQLTQGVYHHNLIINPRQNHRGKVISKNIEFVDYYRHNVRNLPIYGKIACGQKSEGDFDENKYFPILESILDNGDYFVLIAKGDSMINAGIEDGDYVIVKEQSTADDGDIVVALIEGETTLKRLFRDDKRRKIILHPENKDYSDAEYDELDIQGKAVRVIKKLS